MPRYRFVVSTDWRLRWCDDDVLRCRCPPVQRRKVFHVVPLVERQTIRASFLLSFVVLRGCASSQCRVAYSLIHCDDATQSSNDVSGISLIWSDNWYRGVTYPDTLHKKKQESIMKTSPVHNPITVKFN